jgi:hypothetical protein
VKVDVLEDAQRGVEIAAEALRHVGDTPTLCDAERFVGHITIKDLDMALLDNTHAPDQCEQSRLANTVRTDHADHATRGNVDRNIVERNACPVAMRNVLDFGDDAIGHWEALVLGSFTARSLGQGVAVSVRTKPMPRNPVFTCVWYSPSTSGSI